MDTIFLSLLAFSSVLVSATTTWSENLVLADCGIGLGVNGGSTSREMMYYSGPAWGAPKYMNNVPWDGSYPWRIDGVSQTLPNGDRWTVVINNEAGDPNFAGLAWHTYDSVVLTCWSRHLDGLFTLADGKKCSMAYICNHQPAPSGPSPAPAPAPKPPAPSTGPLGENASPGALKYQPVIDFDKSACYNTAAITRDGIVNPGRELCGRDQACRKQVNLGHDECQKVDRLENSNVYVREKCKSDGWCFYLYGYYFEKDEPGDVSPKEGHKHDWEHLAVWTQNGEAKYLAWSAHGNYNVDFPGLVEWEGNHPKFVMHRDWGTTHAFRKAKNNEAPENAKGRWYRSPLVSIEKMDGWLKDKMLNNPWGSAHPDLVDDRFENAMRDTWANAHAVPRPQPNPRPPPQ
ncbi:hypothetical protein ACN47E_006144 [Coniothyrium glycines]